MFDPVTAIVGSSIIGGGLGLLGASQQADAMQSASQTQADASNYAAFLQNQQYQQNFNALAPWRAAGTSAINQLSQLTQPGGELYNTVPTQAQLNAFLDPEFQWVLQQNIDAIKANSAGIGNYGSGNMATGIINYATDQSMNEYAAAYNRWRDSQNALYNRLAGVAGTGQTATNTTAQLGANAATNAGQSGVLGANALASGRIGAANAWGGAINNISNQFMGGVGTYMNYLQNQNLINALQNRTGPLDYVDTGLQYASGY